MGEPPGSTNERPAARPALPRWARFSLLRVRRELLRRRPRRLDAEGRRTVLTLGIVAVVCGGFVLWALLGSPLRTDTAWWGILTGVVCLAATTLTLAVLAVNRVNRPAAVLRAPTRPLRAAVGFFGIAGLAVVLIVVLPQVQQALPRAGGVLGLLLWVGLGCATFTVHRLGAHGSTPAERRAAILVTLLAPSGLLLSAVAVVWVLSGPGLAVWVLLPPLAAHSFGAICIVPALLIRGGILGLEKVRDRSAVTADHLRDRPTRVLWLLAAKIAVLLLAAVAIPRWSPGATLISAQPLSWLGASVAAALVMLLLWFDHRPWPVAPDLHTIARSAALLIGIPLGGLVGVALVIAMANPVRAAPWQAAGVLVVTAATWLPARRFRSIRPAAAWATAALLGLVAGATTGRAAPSAPPQAVPAGTLTLAVVVAITASVLGLAMLALVVIAVRRRRARLLLYLLAVIVWIALNLGFTAWTPGVLALDIDLSLSVLLILGVVAYSRGLTRRIDPAEAAALCVVVFLAMDLPVLLRFTPNGWATAVLVLTFAGSLGLAFWSELPSLGRRGHDHHAIQTLALTSFVTALTAGLAWTVGTAGSGVTEALAGAVLAYASLPVAIVLASQSLSRPLPESG